MKYVKKPIPIEISEQWCKDGDHPNVKPSIVAKWLWANDTWYSHTHFEKEDGYCLTCHKPVHEHGWIGTLEGGHVVCPGDRIVTGVQGEQYPIKPSIFEQTYEPAQDKVGMVVKKLVDLCPFVDECNRQCTPADQSNCWELHAREICKLFYTLPTLEKESATNTGEYE